MKRELPFLSPISLVIAVLICAGLGLSVWKNGGLAFSPGPVTAQASSGITLQQFRSHADFESDCKRCHVPFSSDQARLCTACHENVASQMTAGGGTHSGLDPSQACAGCHPEHRGRAFDPAAFALENYDHGAAGLPLTGAHASLDCAACHPGGVYNLDYQGCEGCHSVPASHTGVYVQGCTACHTDIAWLPAAFDHASLLAADCRACHTAARPAGHWEGQCSACHTTQAWLPASFDHLLAGASDCASCHISSRPADHWQGQCSDCHTTSAWLPASFDHTFPTGHGDANDRCSACHPSGTAAWTCFTCHDQREMDRKHIEEGISNYAIRCLECHPDGSKEGGGEHGGEGGED